MQKKNRKRRKCTGPPDANRYQTKSYLYAERVYLRRFVDFSKSRTRVVKSGGTGGANPFAVLASSEAGFSPAGPSEQLPLQLQHSGGPLVLAALALVLIFFQDLNGTDVGPLCREWGNRRILFRNRHCICRSGVSARETSLWEYRSLCTRLHRNAF